MRLASIFSLFVSSLTFAFWVPAAEATITFSALSPIDLRPDSAGDKVQAIAVADLNHDGKADFIVVQPDTGDISVFLNDGTGKFTNPTVLSSEHSPVAVTTGDFNHDGNIDMAVANDDDDTVTAYLNDGNGNFSFSANVPVDPGPVGLVSADFNNDLKADIAVVTDTTVYLLESNGNGTFSPFSPASMSTRGQGGFTIVAGHINNSHNYVDLAVSNTDSGSVSVFFSNNDGTFQQPPFVIQSGITNPQGLAIGDFSGDHVPDIAVISGIDVDTTLLILVGDGAGGFTVEDTTSTSSASIGSVAMAALDLDLDGKTDLAVGSVQESSGLIQLFCQQESTVCFDNSQGANTVAGNFQIQGTLAVLTGDASALQSGDVNGDGKPDLVAVSQGGDTIKILINTTGQPTATPAATATSEVATPTPTSSVPTPTPTPPFTATPSPTPTLIPTAPYGLCNSKDVSALGNLGKPVAVVTGDFNRDGNTDIAVADNEGNRVALLLSHITSGGADACAVLGLTHPNDVTGIAKPVAMATADLDGDGKPDLAVVGSDGLSVLFGDPDRPNLFADNVVRMPAGTTPQAVAIADFNRDGLPDIIVANAGSNDVSIFLNKRESNMHYRTFNDACQIEVGRSANLVIAGDLNSDGRQDFAIASQQTNDVIVFLQAGSSATPTPGGATSTPGATCSNVTFMSLNGPGRLQQPQAMIFDIFDPTNTIPDLAIATSPGASVGDGSVQVFLGNTSSSGGVVYSAGNPLSVPTPTAQATVHSLPSALGSGDVNRDGRTDLIVTDAKNNDVVIYLANTNGSFAKSLIPFDIHGKNPVALAVADIDGDGTPDIVTGNQDDGSVSVLVSSRPPPTPTPLPTNTPTVTGTATTTGTPTPTATPTPSVTLTPTVTGTPPPTSTAIPSATVPPTLKPGAIALQGSCAVDPRPGHSDWSWVSISLLLLATRWAVWRRDPRRPVR